MRIPTSRGGRPDQGAFLILVGVLVTLFAVAVTAGAVATSAQGGSANITVADARERTANALDTSLAAAMEKVRAAPSIAAACTAGVLDVDDADELGGWREIAVLVDCTDLADPAPAEVYEFTAYENDDCPADYTLQLKAQIKQVGDQRVADVLSRRAVPGDSCAPAP